MRTPAGVNQDLAEPGGEVDLDGLLGGYRPTPGAYDEMVDEGGCVRPHWRPFVERLAREGRQNIAARFEEADRHLRDSGVFYRVYDDPQAAERPWPLSHVPLLISPDDWKTIKAGVIQRARLLEAILADCYGGGQLVERGLLPAALVAGSPDYLRPLATAGEAPQRHLFLYAVDLGRSPNGQWWVVRDRAQAPSGAGYAVENRIALARATSDIYRTFDVERLAPFFDRLRAELAGYREADDAGVCLLTPGALNETYFEHTYLARYLGMRLVEGQDLVVQGGAVYLRTIAGLRKVCVLLRRVDGEFADPLELNQRSQLGVAGLVQAVQAGNVTVANSLGSGFAEARALLGFLPALAGPVLGENLKLPNIATWWCGQAGARETVLASLESLAIAPAFTRTGVSVPPGGPWVMSELASRDVAAVREAIGRRGMDFVGQEVVKLSTTPVWNDGRLEPHPFMFRVFVAATSDGYTVMPGGFALIAEKKDARAVSMQRGARAADVWVLSDGPVQPATLLPGERGIAVRRSTGALPSRAADNLFWLSRYIVRTEATLRLGRALAWRLAERRDDGSADTMGPAELLFRWGASRFTPVAGELLAGATSAMADPYLDGAVPGLVRAARRAASVIRDRFPSDAWRALSDLDRSLERPLPEPITASALYDRADRALRSISAVTGYQLENMNRLSGWRFLKLGLRVERAISVCRFARQLALKPDASFAELDLLLELTDAQSTYRVRYQNGAALAPVLDLVLLDESNPRSLAFQLMRIADHATALPRIAPQGRTAPALATALRLHDAVGAFDPAKVRADHVLGVENGLMQLSDEIAQSYFSVRDVVTPGSAA